MGTRCQVKVTQEGMKYIDGGKIKEAVTLYHHFDGYLSNMVPLFIKAYGIGRVPKFSYGDLYEEAWRLGCIGKAASFLCAADPGAFEPSILILLVLTVPAVEV